MSTELLVRVTVCVHRKPGLNEEEFHKYWAYEHGPLVTEWLQRSKIIKYVQVGGNNASVVLLYAYWTNVICQYHTMSSHKLLGQKMFDATGRVPISYDGMADFWVEKYEDFEAAFLDPYYKEAIQPDERRLFDMDTISVTIGVEYIVLEEGKAVQKYAREI